VNKKEGKVFVWPICTRIIHWTIGLSFSASFFTSFYKEYIHYHIAFGWIFGVMLCYRIIWGFIGPRYAAFNTFRFNLGELKWYFQEKIIDRYRKIPPGHNPASSWYTIIVLSFGISIVISGMLLYGIQDGAGIFGYLNKKYYATMDMWHNLHLYLSYILVAWAFIHIAGVSIEQFYHKTGMIFVMLTGYKKSEGEDTDITRCSNIASYAFIIISFSLFIYIISTYDNVITRSVFEPIDFEYENGVFYVDCGDCHKIYPPYLLPKRSWRRIMRTLDNHFGEEITDANISKKAKDIILKYLEKNAAEHSSRKVSFKVLNSLPPDHAPKSLTKVKYWRDVHKDIDPAIYKLPKVKNRSNCFACHIGLENGILLNEKIELPRVK
jgi:cytochrome b